MDTAYGRHCSSLCLVSPALYVGSNEVPAKRNYYEDYIRDPKIT